MRKFFQRWPGWPVFSFYLGYVLGWILICFLMIGISYLLFKFLCRLI